MPQSPNQQGLANAEATLSNRNSTALAYWKHWWSSVFSHTLESANGTYIDLALQVLFSNSKPIVLNFGSYTCPPFLTALREFATLCADFYSLVDFTTIYSEEAHPTDGWIFESVEYSVIYKNQTSKIQVKRIKYRMCYEIWCRNYK